MSGTVTILDAAPALTEHRIAILSCRPPGRWDRVRGVPIGESLGGQFQVRQLTEARGYEQPAPIQPASEQERVLQP